MMFRGIVFGIGAGWLVIAGVFLFDLLVAKDGWCGHLCPVGAFYNLLGRWSLVKVNAARITSYNVCYTKLLRGLETLKAIKQADVDSLILMLTVSDNEEDVLTALRNGADGYLLKDMEPEDILERNNFV